MEVPGQEVFAGITAGQCGWRGEDCGQVRDRVGVRQGSRCHTWDVRGRVSL